MPTNRIFLADPSLSLSDSLKLAWFAGKAKQPKLQGVIVEILRAITPHQQRKVFFGSSGGGFASLYYSMQFSGSTEVSVNPQTNLAKYCPRLVNAYAREA